MNKCIRAKILIFVAWFPLMAALGILAAACGGSQPQELEIPVRLEGDQLDPGTIQVRQGDTVTLKIESDKPGQFHLHGYDIEVAARAGQVTDLVFLADASGRFRIAFHQAGDDHQSHQETGHGEQIQSEVLHPGDSFTFQVPLDLEGKVIYYHSHLHPEVTGMVHVSSEAPPAGTVPVELNDDGAHPHEISVRPGTHIVWTNNGTQLQALASGDHPASEASYVEFSHQAMGEAGGGGHGQETEEIDIGFLEVQPR